MIKKLLNLHEDATHLRLRKVCEQYGASVHAKVRIADVLDVDRSSREDRGFALTSHFDFVITDLDHMPLFAVEFDGPSHAEPLQQARDGKKNRICETFDFPLLRINARYLPQRYRDMDLLSWFVEVWFLQRSFEEAQENGSIPADEPFFPFSVVGRLGENRPLFPFWLSQPLLVGIRKFWEAGRCLNPAPNVIVGVDQSGTYRAMAWIPVSRESAVLAETAMRAQRFPVREGDLLDELVIFELYRRLVAVLERKERAWPVADVRERVDRFRRSTRLCHSSSCGEDIPKDFFQQMEELAGRNLPDEPR